MKNMYSRCAVLKKAQDNSELASKMDTHQTLFEWTLAKWPLVTLARD